MHFPDGTKVTIEPGPPKRRTLADRYAGFIGIADDRPPDFAKNHDHHINGTPKRP